MSKRWTEQQQDAINARNGSILVSAAAGSGKTAVLVQRVIQMLTDDTKPSTADRLLIVTFTRAAASEMKERITLALDESIRKNPNDTNLVNQRMLLPLAKICTIDSFCNLLVRENFQLLDVPADFKNADEGEMKIIQKQAIDATLAQMYEQNDEGFLSLVEFLFKGRDDSYLASVIMDLYKNSMSFPFPNKWLDELIIPFEKETELWQSRYGQILTNYIEFGLAYCINLCTSVISEVSSDEMLNKIYLTCMQKVMENLEQMKQNLDDKDWDTLAISVQNFKMPRRGNFPKGYDDEVEKGYFETKRDEIKEIITKKLSPLFCSTSSEYTEDMEFFLPHVKKLVECAKLYGEKFVEFKLEKKLVDFNDITQMALKLLVVQTKDGYEPTELAMKLRDDFDEILIDEYQDTNKAQDMLFTSISNNNLFRVGDVKQSIYKFRQAMPEIFIGLKEDYPLYDRSKDNYPAKIILGKNFRSSNFITDNINFIFEQIMSKQMGDIDYGEEEQLNCGADYPSEISENQANFNMVFCDLAKAKEREISKDEYEAQIIAEKIEEMVKNGVTVKDGDTRRAVNYGDFCVMLRSVNGGRGAMYAQTFKDVGLPTYVEFTTEFFQSSEITMILSLLRIIDNPKQDVPLLALMHSPIYGFTVDEIASIKIAQRKGSFYSAVMSFAVGENEENKKALEKVLSQKDYDDLVLKVQNFQNSINSYRSLSVCLGTSELIRSLYEETALTCLVDAIDKTGIKRSNLMLFLQYAKTYETLGYIGLSGFIRFIDRLGESKSDLPSSLGSSQELAAIKIMSIHKSKGLEFPVCFLANCAGRFNTMDERKNVIINLKHGLGLVKRDAKTYEQFQSVSHTAMKLGQRLESLSEELRVLYVALTRAKEYLYLVHSSKDIQKEIVKVASKINRHSNVLSPFLVSTATSFSSWILPALFRHGDAEKFLSENALNGNLVRTRCGKDNKYDKHPHLQMFESSINWQQWEKDKQSVAQSEKNQNSEKEIQSELEKYENRFNFKYAYEPLTMLTSKRAASEQENEGIDEKYFATAKPSFLNDNEMSGAQKGIITHEFVQYADFKLGAVDVQKEIDRLIEQGFILKEQAKGINQKAAANFFNSDIVKRMNESEAVYREKKFTFEESVSVRGEEFAEFKDEKIMVQGIADCVFVEDGKLVIIDYKTDRVQDEAELVRKYKAQVDTYAAALSVCMAMPVKQSLLYSFYLNKEIAVYGSK